MKKIEIITFAKGIVTAEKEAVEIVEQYIDDQFVQVVEMIYNSTGRVVITGIGKSAIIAQKIVATLNSTGTPATFLHAADAIHGDMGVIQPLDTIICISKSGNSPEIKVLVPLIKKMGNTLVAMVGNVGSHLQQNADYTLNTTVLNEACPNNLAPTSSTTAQLVMGDALAMTLLKMKGFTAKDFSKSHPGGALGKKLYTTVNEIMQTQKPQVKTNTPISEVIVEISAGRLGAVAVVQDDDDEKLVGIITDGDIRRMLQNNQNISGVKAVDIMTKNPKTINGKELAVKAYQIMEQNKIMNILVVDNEKYKGIIHLHDIHTGGIV